MHDIDLHIIVYDEPKWQVDRCLASLEGQPVNIHIVKGVKERPPKKGRMAGYRLGSAPYQTFVDPDDVVRPGAFAALLEYAGYDLIYGNEDQIIHDELGGELGRSIGVHSAMHHAYLLKRGVGDPLCRMLSSWVWNMARALNLSVKHVDQVIYEWHRYPL